MTDSHHQEVTEFIESRFSEVPLLDVDSKSLIRDAEFDTEEGFLCVVHKGRTEDYRQAVSLLLAGRSSIVFSNDVYIVFHARSIANEPNAVKSYYLGVLAQETMPVEPVDESAEAGFEDRIAQRVAMLSTEGKPNVNALWLELKELNAIKWSVKQQGYAIGRQVFDKVSGTDVPQAPGAGILLNKCSTQADVESSWFRYWISELHSAPLPHRKLWEFGYILQNLHSLGMMKEGRSAIGFGCGEEPLPSYFASKGVAVTVTDLDPAIVAGMGWAETGQHTDTLEKAFASNLVDRETFDRLVELQYVDMNDIPAALNGRYDFCWSVCALEHLGSVRRGLDFIKNSLGCLKPGGVAIHTTEFNYTETDRTVDNWQTVLFLQKHFEELATELREAGYIVRAFDFDVGSDPLDTFVDLPPYEFREFLNVRDVAEDDSYRPGHLKLSVDGFPATCIAITVERPATL